MILALAALAALTGCSKPAKTPDAGAPPVERAWLEGALPPANPNERPRSGGTLVVRLPDEPAGLNLLDDAHQGLWATRVTRNLVYESLCEEDPVALKLKPLLAESVTVHSDARSFTFRLKAGRVFADGSPVTAEDVLASIDAVMSPLSRASIWRKRLANLERWQRKGPLEVEVSFLAPAAFSLRTIASLPIYSRKSLEGDFATLEPPLGSGPYAVTEWVRGERLVLEHNVLSPAPARLDRIVFRIVKDPAAAWKLTREGAFDLVVDVAPGDWRSIEAREPGNLWAQQGYWRIQALQNDFSYLAWNTRLPVLKPPHARVAFGHVFPAKKIFEQVDLGLELSTSCPYYVGGYGCVRELGVLRYDPGYARAVLVDGGFVDSDGDGVLELDGQPLELSFVAPTDPPRMGKIAALYKEELRKIGAQLQIETVSPEVLEQRKRARDFGVVGAQHTGLDSDTDLLPLLHSREADGGTNLSGFEHPQVDHVLELIQQQASANRRHQLEQRMHEAVREAQPMLVFSTHPSLDLARRRVRGLVPAPTWYDLRSVWLAAKEAAADAGR